MDENLISKLSKGVHQFKSPINSLYTLLDVIIYTYKNNLPEEVKKLLFSALNKAEELKYLVDEILKLSKIDKDSVKLEIINLERFINDLLNGLKSEAEKKKLDFIVNLSEKLPEVKTDASILYNIIFNIVDNSINYTPAGGKISIKIEIDKKSNLLKFFISDTGIGIPKEYHKYLFTEFFRAPNAKLERKTGTGLGLTIVKKSVEVLGGKIEFKSEVGQGTEFFIEIPIEIVKSKKRNKKITKVVIIGGGAAGPKTAAKLMRMKKDFDITLIEKGEFLSYSGCGLPFYISGAVKDKAELMSSPAGELRNPDFFKRIGGIKVYNYTEAIKIDRKQKIVTVKSYKDNKEFNLSYDYLVIATGGKPKLLNVEGVKLKNIFTLHTVEDADRLREILAPPKVKEGVIIGAGLIGMELAESLLVKGTRVTVIEKQKRILPLFDEDISELIKNQIELKGIKFLVEEEVLKFEGKEQVEWVVTNKRRIPADFVIIAIGIEPNVELAKNAGLKIGKTSAIEVNSYLQTSDKFIYAVGDCAENFNIVTKEKEFMPLGSIANKHGRIAAINIAGGKIKFKGIVKTVVFKIFDISVGKAGLNTKEALEHGFEPLSVLVPTLDKEHYYYEAEKIIIKLIGDRKSDKLLGAQIFGSGDVVRRIDVVATALSKNIKIKELRDLDLAYVPAFGLPFDPIIVAANVWENYKYKGYEKIDAFEFYEKLNKNSENLFIIDVRLPKEYEQYSIPNSINIPLATIRGRIDTIPKNKEIILICDTGLRSYNAFTILKKYGFKNVKILNGGISCLPSTL